MANMPGMRSSGRAGRPGRRERASAESAGMRRRGRTGLSLRTSPAAGTSAQGLSYNPARSQGRSLPMQEGLTELAVGPSHPFMCLPRVGRGGAIPRREVHTRRVARSPRAIKNRGWSRGEGQDTAWKMVATQFCQSRKEITEPYI